jgi:putative membrane protein
MMGGYTFIGGMFWMGLLWMSMFTLIIWSLILQCRIYENTRQNDALTILKRRYAQGQISREEFEQAKLVLQ